MKRSLSIIGFSLVFLSACVPGISPSVDPQNMQNAVNARVTELVRQTQTASVSPSSSNSQSYRATIPPDQNPVSKNYQADFDGSELYVAYQGDSQTQINIVVPEGIQGDFRANIGEAEFSCETYIINTVSRLICIGPTIARGQIFTLSVYPKERQDSIYERQFTTPK